MKGNGAPTIGIPALVSLAGRVSRVPGLVAATRALGDRVPVRDYWVAGQAGRQAEREVCKKEGRKAGKQRRRKSGR